MHYSGFGSRYDEYIDFDSPRIQKQCNFGLGELLGRKDTPFRLNNRLDILDKYGKWLEGIVTEINGKMIKIRFKGYHPKYDEWIDTQKEAHKIKEVGALS